MKKMLERCRNALRYAEVWIFLAASLFLILYAIAEVRTHNLATSAPHAVFYRILLLSLICVLFYLATRLLVERTGRKGIMRLLFGFFFVLYLYLLLNVTLWDKGLGRDLFTRLESEDARNDYLRNFVNLQPFHSIYEVYIQGFLKGYLNGYYVILNLLGNLLVLSPLAFFLPYFFPLQRRLFLFLPSVTLFSVGVEALQFFLMVGSCDVDDVILNALGALLSFLLLRLPPVSRLIARM